MRCFQSPMAVDASSASVWGFTPFPLSLPLLRHSVTPVPLPAALHVSLFLTKDYCYPGYSAFLVICSPICTPNTISKSSPSYSLSSACVTPSIVRFNSSQVTLLLLRFSDCHYNCNWSAFLDICTPKLIHLWLNSPLF